MKRKVITLLTLAITTFVTSQVVNIPDLNFKKALLNHSPKIDKNNNGEIEINEAKSFKGTISCYNKQISDLTGIEAFENIKELLCFKNKLKTIDVSKITNLWYLNCDENQLTDLDVSKKHKFDKTCLLCE